LKVLITGGTGFIGSRLALRCLELSNAVTVVGQENNPTELANARMLKAAGVELALGSVTDAPLIERALEGVDVVFHLAAVQHEMNVPDQVFHDVNVQGTVNVLNASARQKVKSFVHGSTIGVYGAQTEPVDESTPCRPDNIYGVTKLEGEKMALSFNGKVPVVAIRISEVYGPGDRRLLKLFAAIQRGMFMMIGPGRNLHHPIYVDDLIQGLLLASCRKEASGKILLLPGKEAVSTRTMVDTIREVLRARKIPFRVPLPPVVLLATITEKLLRPLGIQPPLHRRRIDFFRKSFSLSGKRAAEVLGFTAATGFREGVAQTADWYRQNGLLK
jgi:dihydroflavonol-4-reductase